MRILLTGANGQVGWEIARRAGVHEVLALNRAALDITQAEAVERAFAAHAPGLVINAAAYTAVDRAEQEPARAFAVNRDGPAHLAAACARRGIPLFHLSTDYVFDGRRAEPYREDDATNPLGVYGHSKWAGEEAVRRTLDRHLIARVSWVFGAHGHNFVKTMLRLARERDELRVVADQRGCPTHAGAIAEMLLTLAERWRTRGELAWGTYHYGNTPATTWHGFAQAIVDLAGAREPLRARSVLPITTADYPTPAARPANSVLACDRLRAVFGLVPCTWAEGLREVIADTVGPSQGGG